MKQALYFGQKKRHRKTGRQEYKTEHITWSLTTDMFHHTCDKLLINCGQFLVTKQGQGQPKLFDDKKKSKERPIILSYLAKKQPQFIHSHLYLISTFVLGAK